jgi:hypothetical protein
MRFEVLSRAFAKTVVAIPRIGAIWIILLHMLHNQMVLFLHPSHLQFPWSVLFVSVPSFFFLFLRDGVKWGEASINSFVA